MRSAAAVLGGILLVCGCAFAQGASLETARQQYDAGNYPAAISILQTALSHDPEQARFHYWLERCYYELKDYGNAISEGEKSIKLDPGDSDAHLWLGRAYGRQADRSRSYWLARKTKHEFEEAVRLNPRNIAARRDLMEFEATAPWIVGGSREKAEEQADGIATIDPVEGALAHAEYWKDQKRIDLSEAECRRALAMKPKRVDPYLEVADLFARRGEVAQVEAAVEAAAQINASDQRLSYYRGMVRVLAGNRLGEAELYLKAYLATAPERSDLPSHAEARGWLGRLYELEGKRLEAAEQYRAALQLDPTFESARASLQRLEKQSN